MELRNFLRVKKRLSRGHFWLQAVVLWGVFYLLSTLLEPFEAGVLVWLVNGVALAVLVSLCLQRLHDRNHTGWWLLVVFIPVLGALWLLWQLALRRGVPQENRWGPDPLTPRRDYLIVN